MRPLVDVRVERHVDALLRPEAQARRGVRTVPEALREFATAAIATEHL